MIRVAATAAAAAVSLDLSVPPADRAEQALSKPRQPAGGVVVRRSVDRSVGRWGFALERVRERKGASWKGIGPPSLPPSLHNYDAATAEMNG